jgi:hypothetical protein
VVGSVALSLLWHASPLRWGTASTRESNGGFGVVGSLVFFPPNLMAYLLPAMVVIDGRVLLCAMSSGA